MTEAIRLESFARITVCKWLSVTIPNHVGLVALTEIYVDYTF